MKTIAIVSLKGGVGKTTLVVNLGAALSAQGKSVLLVDLDPQQDLSQNLGMEATSIKGIEYLLTADLEFDTILQRYNGKFHFLPAGKKLKETELLLARAFHKMSNAPFLLRQALDKISPLYDYILIDCPPSPGMLSINALTFVNHVYIPVQCQPMGFRGSKRTVFFIHKIRAFYNRELQIDAVIPTMFDVRNKLSKAILKELQDSFDQRTTKSIIRVNIALAEAPAFGQTIFDYNPNCRGASDFKQLAAEILEWENGELD